LAHNPTKALPDWPPVIVAGAYYTGVALMRSLARRGVKVSCIDCNRSQAGFQTTYGPANLCPDPDVQPAEWLEFMISLAPRVTRKGGQKPVLICSSDRFVSAIAQHAGALEAHFTFCSGSIAAQELLATKRRQYDVAGKHGLPVPRTQFVESLDQLMAFAADARFPCLIKPIHFRDWQRFPKGHPLLFEKIAVVSDATQLAERYKLAAAVNPRMIVQEVIEGPDTAKLVYMSCYNQKGDRIARCMMRELRTTPIYYGSASVVEPCVDDEVDALCDAFLRGIQYSGLCEIELKRDSRDGRVKMIEANPRFSLTADSAYYAGVDMGWIHYLDLIGELAEPVEPDGSYFRHITLIRDFDTVRSYRKAGLLTWREIAASYFGPVKFLDFDLRDWRVTGGTVYALFKLIIGPPIRKMFSRK